MRYYRVKPEHDNKPLKSRLIYVKNELFTEKECERYKVNKAYCDLVEVSKRSTFFFFGSRYALEECIPVS